MGNTASRLHEWLESNVTKNGLHSIHPSSEEKKIPPSIHPKSEGHQILAEEELPSEAKDGTKDVFRHTIPEHLNGLLSLICKEKLHLVRENKYFMGIKDKDDPEYNPEYPRIISGTIAEDFQLYLKTHSPENNLKFSFLIITELVLEGKDQELFQHLASVFFDRQEKNNINLRNRKAQDELFKHITTKHLKFEECLNLLTKKGKLGPDMLTRNGGINSMYKEFRELKIKENSKRCACILSIL